MSCNLCNQFHDIGSPHEKNDIMKFSKSVEINYKKIEYKHEEELIVEIKFMCANGNLIHTMDLKNHTEMDEEKTDFNYNSMVSIVDTINELKLEIYFEGKYHVRHGIHAGIFVIDPDDVLIHNVDDNSLSYIYMSVY